MIVIVNEIVDNGAYVRLLEYDNIEGMITPNEYSKMSNIKTIHRVIKKDK